MPAAPQFVELGFRRAIVEFRGPSSEPPERGRPVGGVAAAREGERPWSAAHGCVGA